MSFHNTSSASVTVIVERLQRDARRRRILKVALKPDATLVDDTVRVLSGKDDRIVATLAADGGPVDFDAAYLETT